MMFMVVERIRGFEASKKTRISKIANFIIVQERKYAVLLNAKKCKMMPGFGR